MSIFDDLRAAATRAGITEEQAMRQVQAALDALPEGDCEACERRPAFTACEDGKNRCESCCAGDGFSATTGRRLLTSEAVQAALGASHEQGIEELHAAIFGTSRGDDASYDALGAELRALEAAGTATRRSLGGGLYLWRLAAAPAPASLGRRITKRSAL